jgi:integrase/recombinase XerD
MMGGKLPAVRRQSPLATMLDQLAGIPEEDIWLAKQKSARTRRAYRLDVQHFMKTLGIATVEELRQVDHRAVIAWERIMREVEHAAASTIRRRLAALSSLYKHLVRHDHAAKNPVAEGRAAGDQPRRRLDPCLRESAGAQDARRAGGGYDRRLARPGDPLRRLAGGLAARRDRGAQGRRPAPEPDSLRVSRKGGRRDALAINPQTAARLRAYLEASGHGADIDGPLFRPLRHNGKRQEQRRHMDPDAIDRVVRKYATELGLDRGYSAHSMRATFITTALENGAQLEDVQKAAGHRDPSTTKLYDRRGYNPEKVASFFATY